MVPKLLFCRSLSKFVPARYNSSSRKCLGADISSLITYPPSEAHIPEIWHAVAGRHAMSVVESRECTMWMEWSVGCLTITCVNDGVKREGIVQ